MEILKGLHRTGRSDIVLKSIVWKSVIEVFKEKKHIDITPYLISITTKKDLFVIKTNKPLINSELYQLEESIKETITQKMKQIGIKWKNLELKFI